MDPLSLALGAVGLGMQIFGGMSAANNAKQQAAVAQDEAAQEQGINNAKQQAMELNGRRSQLENLRNNQRARAQGIEASVNQGAQFGSGIQGGLAATDDNSMFNMVGVNSALQTGRQINAFNSNISTDKMKMAALGGTAATDQGIASLGGSLLKSAPTLGAIGQSGWNGLKSMNLGQGQFGGGSPSGY